MSKLIAGHVLHYKDASGNWVAIPVFTSDIYHNYVQYCKDNNIEPVSQNDYYITLGTLSTLVQQLAGSANAMQAMSNALGVGALPTHMGGLGVSLSLDEYIYTLTNTEPVDWNTAYANYFKMVDGSYTALTQAEPWTANTYYSRHVPTFKGTLLDYLTAPSNSPNGVGLNLALNTSLTALEETLKTGINEKINKNAFTHGKYNPDKNTAGTYYFQYE